MICVNTLDCAGEEKKGLGEILKQLRQRQAEDKRSRVGCRLGKRREMGEGGGRQTGRQAGGAIIAGFMYELLIESVVTS